MKNSFKLKRQLTCEIALKTLPMLTFAFCVGVPVAIAEPLIKGTESTATPSDNSSIITTPTDPNATDSNSRRLTPHKYYKGANPSSENNSEESKNTGTTYRNEATGSGTRFRNGTKGIGTGTSYRDDPSVTGTGTGTSGTGTSGTGTSGTGTSGTGTSGTGTSGTGTSGTGTSGTGTSGSGSLGR